MKLSYPCIEGILIQREIRGDESSSQIGDESSSQIGDWTESQIGDWAEPKSPVPKIKINDFSPS